MRATVVTALIALAACAPETRSNNALPDEWTDGAIVAVGESWRLNGDPALSLVSIYMADGTETSGTWVSPYYVKGRISASDIRVTLEHAACEQDKVSYPMRATVTFPGHALTGCASMRWDSDIDELIEPIDACIAQAPEWRTVTYAGVLADGAVLVRLRNGQEMQDCRVEHGRAKHSPRDESLLTPTENAAIFLRARPGETTNPGGECYEAPEVFQFGHHWSRMVGWLLDAQGC